MDEFKLILGDCLEQLKPMGANSIDAVVTDPPYGITQNKWDSTFSLVDFWREILRVCKPNAPIVSFCAHPFTSILINSNREMFKYCWYWEKPSATGFLNAKKQPLRVIEEIAVFYKGQCLYNPQFSEGEPYKQKSGRQSENYGDQVSVTTDSDGRRYPINLLRFSRDKDRVHPTQKPVALMQYLLRTYVPSDGVILDPFMGSGSTGVAAAKLGYRFIGIELSQEYLSIAQKRIEHEAGA